MQRGLWWVWAGIGVAAVVILVAVGGARRPGAPLPAVPSLLQPIIVEPIQPNPAAPPGFESPPLDKPEVRAPAATSGGSPAVVAMGWPAEGPDRVRAIQQALHAAGYDPGPIDGKLGRLTQKAIREFQEAHGLSVDGKVGPKTGAMLEPYLRPKASASATDHR